MTYHVATRVRSRLMIYATFDNLADAKADAKTGNHSHIWRIAVYSQDKLNNITRI